MTEWTIAAVSTQPSIQVLPVGLVTPLTSIPDDMHNLFNEPRPLLPVILVCPQFYTLQLHRPQRKRLAAPRVPDGPRHRAPAIL
jgi:hypothetical protein